MGMLRPHSYRISLLLCLWPVPSAFASRVLVLNSYSPEFPTTDRLLAGIHGGLGGEHEVDVIYLDSKSPWSTEYAEDSLRVVASRLEAKAPYDIIISTDDHALELIQLDGGNVLKGPVVVAGINHPDTLARARAADPRITGVVEAPDLEGLGELLSVLQPNASAVWALLGSAHSSNEHLRLLQRTAPLPVRVLRYDALGDSAVREQLRTLDDSAAVVILGLHRGSGGQQLDAYTISESLCADSGAPCYSFWDHWMTPSVLGGPLIDMEEQGYEAATIARRILGGAAPAAIPTVPSTPSVVTLNRGVLARWPGMGNRVPAGAILLPRPYWTLSRALAWAAGVLAVVGVLWAGRRWYRRQITLPQEALRFATLGRVAAGVIHDLNNLLQVVLASGQLLQQDPNTPQTAQPMLTLLEESAMRAGRLTRRVLSWIRGRSDPASTLELGSALAELSPILKGLFGNRVRVFARVSPEPLFARISPAGLDQLLLNLAANARDANARAIVLGLERVTAHAAEDVLGAPLAAGRWVRIWVQDDGEGMPPATLARALRLLFTTRAQGTGLGLYIVRQTLEDAGGRLGVISAEGQGTTVSLYLPEQEAPPPHKPSPAQAARPGRIWVVEGNAQIRSLLVAILEEHGHTAQGWRTAQEVTQALQDRPPPDLLLIDELLPDQDGQALRAQLRARCPIVLMSNTIKPDGVDVIEKPADTHALLSAVAAALQRRAP